MSHVAWQVGHLAVAEYRLALWRIRGPQPQDGDVIPALLPSVWTRVGA